MPAKRCSLLSASAVTGTWLNSCCEQVSYVAPSRCLPHLHVAFCIECECSYLLGKDRLRLKHKVLALAVCYSWQNHREPPPISQPYEHISDTIHGHAPHLRPDRYGEGQGKVRGRFRFLRDLRLSSRMHTTLPLPKTACSRCEGVTNHLVHLPNPVLISRPHELVKPQILQPFTHQARPPDPQPSYSFPRQPPISS